MAKLTNGRVLDMLKSTCNVQDWKTWNDPKGDSDRTKINHLIALCCVKDCINTISVFEPVYPDGVGAAIEKYKDKFELFRQRFIREYPDDFIAYARTIDLAPIGATKYNVNKDPALEVEKFAGKQQEAEEEPKQAESEYGALNLRELRKLCRERDITIPSGAKAEDLIALLEEQDESGEEPSNNQEESVSEDSEEEEEVQPTPKKKPAKVEEPEEPAPKKKPAKKVEESEPEEAEDLEDEEESPKQSEPVKAEEQEEDVEEASPYDEMELEELREECDKRGIEYKKNTKAHVLIELLTNDDKQSAEQENEDTQKEVDELDDLLDENFVDEEIEAVAQEEKEVKSAKAKKNKR